MDISGKLNQTLTYRVPAGLDANQDRTWSANVTIKGRVEARLMLIRNYRGDQVMSSHVIYTETPVSRDAWWLVDGEWRRTQQSLSTPSLDAGQMLYKTWVGSRE